jgi:predicted TIM-barrel fold metal-dependent hydrolase
MTVVDAHLHVFSDDPARYPYDGRWGMIPQEPTPVEELIACMDVNGVDKAVMVQGAAYLYDNRYMADCRALFPDRLAAVALLDPRAPGAADRLEEFWERDRIQGFRLYPIRDKDASWLHEASQDAVWVRAGKLGVPLIAFIGMPQLPHLGRIAERHPETAVLIDHLGQPDRASDWPEPSLRELLDLARLPNVSVKVSATPPWGREMRPDPRVAPLMRRVYEAFGAHRLLWSCGLPRRDPAVYAQGISLMERATPNLSNDERALVMGGTAMKLYRFE